MLGMSVAANALNVGAAAAPVAGPANTKAGFWLFHVNETLPDIVTGTVEKENSPGPDIPTLVTVPPEENEVAEIAVILPYVSTVT
jgi:hypothetical protein